MSGTAEHRPALRQRRFAHDDLIAVDLFSGFGGLTQGIETAGFTTIMAANHNRYKVEVHEANFPHAEHWIADLVDKESPDYHSARELPPGDLLVAGVSCVNHSQANTVRAYEQGLTLFDLEDPEFEARVTRSERDRATANCVLHYAERHHPRTILVECTTELTSWGPAVPGKRKVGDGSTYRWWLRQFANLGYRHRVLYLNSMFFGVPQSRDRLYIVFWDRRLPAPDLAHRPASWCSRCDRVVEAVWTWRTGIPPTGSVRYGKQYDYRCPSCRGEVIPPMTPSLHALDLSNLGTRIGDKPIRTFRGGSTGPMAASTMARAERCRQRFADFPAVVVPAQMAQRWEGHPWPPANDAAAAPDRPVPLASTGVVIGAAGNTYERPGSDCRSRGLDQPLWAQTATNSLGLLTPPIAVAVDNYQGSPRGAGEPFPTQPGSETLGLLTARVLPNRTNGTSRSLAEPMETLVGSAGSGGLGLLSSGVVPADQLPMLMTAAGTIKCNGGIEEAKYRTHPLSDPLGTVVGSAITQGVLFSGWYKQNGSTGSETAPHPLSDPFGTLTARDTTALLYALADSLDEWRDFVTRVTLDDCWFKMLGPHEVGRGCGFDVDFPGYDYHGSFKVWGSARDQVDGYGNAVSPQVGAWIGWRLRPILHTPEAAA
jgi:DNA (cytosine-5)-methyltransferase 1